MAVTMICPNLKCGQTVVAPDSARGKVVRCVHCHQLFMVPAPANESQRQPLSKSESDEGGRGKS
jgi:hypothetical protein